MPPVVGAIVGAVVAIIILIVAGLILSRYAPRCRNGAAHDATIPTTPPPHPRINDISLCIAQKEKRCLDNVSSSSPQTQSTDIGMNILSDMKRNDPTSTTSLKLKEYSSGKVIAGNEIYDGNNEERNRSQCIRGDTWGYHGSNMESTGSNINNPDLVRGTG